MASVCFTGKGLRQGKEYTRQFWAADAEACGWIVHDSVTPSTDYLVASRNDTHKAISARANGTRVITYDQFTALLDGKDVDASGLFDRASPPPPAKPVDMSAMEGIEGWGTF